MAPSRIEGDETLLFLSLSGGGYRAVALDYGIIQELDRIEIGEGRTLLDEVDVVLSVSAAALPAAYLGTFGPEVFLERFREEVLLQPLQSQLTKKLFSPFQWFRLASSRFSRSDLAAEIVDEMLEGRTFGDLRRQRPLVVLNATDVSLGARFPFLQSSFDLGGSEDALRVNGVSTPSRRSGSDLGEAGGSGGRLNDFPEWMAPFGSSSSPPEQDSRAIRKRNLNRFERSGPSSHILFSDRRGSEASTPGMLPKRGLP